VGQASEDLARFFGTARYLFIQTLIVIAWIATNVILAQKYVNSHPGCSYSTGAANSSSNSASCSGTRPFDPYPFILLNLAFSTQAAYAAPLILLAQNRQANRDRIQAEFDRERFERNLADTEYLMREIAEIRHSQGSLVTREHFARATSSLASTLASIEQSVEELKRRCSDEDRLNGEDGGTRL
jgi:uncharacterized membrane protein